MNTVSSMDSFSDIEKNNLVNLVIESENLKIIPISSQYREDIFREFTTDITKYMFPQAALDINETDRFIEKSRRDLDNKTQFTIVILDKYTSEFMGGGGLHNIHTRTPEFGIWIKKGAHGNGHGKEAVFALRAWADESLDYEYLLYPVVRENTASRKIPEAMGGVIFREYCDCNALGEEQDTIEYRIYPHKKIS
ncbi:MAG: GNAT family N-acetyltransferase [Candidatus Gracilibacteria bacterium]|nr:GNAT family N-acetyltransferase [Candidatus Gracilibacteria bacterium]